MADILISHSGKDGEVAAAIGSASGANGRPSPCSTTKTTSEQGTLALLACALALLAVLTRCLDAGS